ncbi:MAG: hypothetical protein WCO56_06105 [Verrucomicrobiota bacterium]
MNPQSLAPAAQAKLKQVFQLGLQQGCPKDQLLNFAKAGIVLQTRQLAASAAARLCDQPGGPKAIGYGGARGGGKSHWLLAQLGADDCQRIPGLKCLLLRKVGKSNLENFEDLRRRLFHRLPHEFNASRGLLTFANGSRIVLGHYQCEKDIDAYLGLEYDVIAIEEATQLTLRKYEDISSCCRTSKPNWHPRMYSTTNPGGIGHQWYYEKFIVPSKCGTESATRFIPARVDDNAFINPEYKVHLASRTGWQYAAWYQGQWDISAGQYFKNFRPEVHILDDQFKESLIVKWFAAMDYGYTHRNVVLLGGFDHADNLYVLDELAERLWIAKRQAQAIKAMIAQHGIYLSEDHLRESLLAQYPEHCQAREMLWCRGQKKLLSWFVAGADLFSRESNGESTAEQYRKHGLNLRPAYMDRMAGWSAILDRLGDPDHGIPPTLFIHKRCQHLLACLPYVQHDPDRPGDVLKTNVNEEGTGGDDAADALRYLVASRSPQIYVRKLTGA